MSIEAPLFLHEANSSRNQAEYKKKELYFLYNPAKYQRQQGMFAEFVQPFPTIEQFDHQLL